jgi:predicted DNA-binding transcriptional regulator AlpA
MSTITPSPGQSSMADVVLMLQTAYPRDWENHLRNFFGASVPADLPPAELARFTERVSWMVKQAGIKDPAGWLAFQRAQEEKKKEKEAAMALAAAIEWEALIETGDDTPVQRDSVDPEPVKLGVDPVSGEPPAAPVAATTTLSPSEIAKDKITIGGQEYVSNPRLASMLGISERTLSRLLRNDDGPPHVKIGGNYYRLDKIPEWAAARGLRPKTPSDNH